MEPTIYAWLFVLVVGGNAAEQGLPIQMTQSEDACKFIARRTASEYGLPTAFRCVPIVATSPNLLTPNVRAIIPARAKEPPVVPKVAPNGTSGASENVFDDIAREWAAEPKPK